LTAKKREELQLLTASLKMAELVESASIQLFMVICGTDTRLQFIPEAHITELDEF
jgi:hypothetical protein